MSVTQEIQENMRGAVEAVSQTTTSAEAQLSFPEKARRRGFSCIWCGTAHSNDFLRIRSPAHTCHRLGEAHITLDLKRFCFGKYPKNIPSF